MQRKYDVMQHLPCTYGVLLKPERSYVGLMRLVSYSFADSIRGCGRQAQVQLESIKTLSSSIPSVDTLCNMMYTASLICNGYEHVWVTVR